MNDVNAYIGQMNFDSVSKNLLKIHNDNGSYYNEQLKNLYNTDTDEYSSLNWCHFGLNTDKEFLK